MLTMRGRRSFCHTVVYLAALAQAAAIAYGQQPLSMRPEQRPHFKSAVNLTTVTATVTDADGRLIRDLPREQFELFEDGERQPITQFTNERVPVSLGILVDASDSMFGRRIADARAAIDHFVSELLDPADEFSLLVFNHHQQLLADWTGDRTVAERMLTQVKPWGATAIYDALLSAIPLAESRHKQRAAMLVVSDGADTASDARLRDVRSALLRTDVFVYAIGIDSPDRRAINAPLSAATLGQITDQSGGRTRIVHDSAEVVTALEQIAAELNSQYLIGYTSARQSDGKFHSIRVHVKDGTYKVRARSGFIG
jgi:VWFA-related protein